MADLHGQTLVTTLSAADRIAAGVQGQTGAVNILRDDLKNQFINPTTGEVFSGTIDLSQVQGTFYNDFTQSANITFNFANTAAGGKAYIRVISNGTGTFNFTAIESFGLNTGDTLPSGTYLFRFFSTPAGVTVTVLRETLVNNASEDEIPISDAQGNLVGSGITTQSSANQLIFISRDREFRINAGNNTAAAVRNILITTIANQGFAASGDVNLLTGSVIGSGNTSGALTINTGSATSGATKGAIAIGDNNDPALTLNGYTWPTTDGTAGQVITTNGNRVLSFADPGITNGAANNEIPVSDGTNLVGSGLIVTTTVSPTGIVNIFSGGREFRLSVGSPSATTSKNLLLTTLSTLNSTDSGDINLNTGAVSGSGNQSGDIVINTGSGTSGGTKGGISIGDNNDPALTLNGYTWPTSDGTNGQVLTTNGNRVLSFTTVAGGGGITNGAANNEIPKSDGTNLISSGLVSAATGNLNLGGSTDAGAIRTLSADGSATTVSLALNAKGGSSLIRFSYQGVNTRHDLTASQLLLGTFGSGNFNIHSSTVPIILGASPNVVAANTQPVTISTTESSGLNNNSGSVTIATGNSSNAGGGNSGNISIATGTATTTRGTVSIQGLTWPQVDGADGQAITTDGTGTLSFSDTREVGAPNERIETLTSATNAVSINWNSLSRHREFSLTLNENTTVSFTNAANRSLYIIYLNITGASRTITLPASAVMPPDTSNITGVEWTTATNTLELPIGLFELAANFDGTNDYFKLAGPYS